LDTPLSLPVRLPAISLVCDSSPRIAFLKLSQSFTELIAPAHRAGFEKGTAFSRAAERQRFVKGYGFSRTAELRVRERAWRSAVPQGDKDS
jgi:hypothetical protein